MITTSCRVSETFNYYAWKRGPVPKTLWKEISGDMCDDLKQAITIVPIEHFQKIVSKKKKFDDKHFTKREIKLLKLTADIFMVKKALKGDLEKKGHIPNQKMNEIANCFKRIDDVSPYRLKLIRKSREA